MLGQKRPKLLRRFFIEYTCLQRTFSIEKARKRLGYTPVDDRDEMIRAGVEWELQKGVEAENRNFLDTSLWGPESLDRILDQL